MTVYTQLTPICLLMFAKSHYGYTIKIQSK